MSDGKPEGGTLVRRRMGEFRRFVVESSLIYHLGRFVVPLRLGLVLPGAGFITPNGRGLLPPNIAFYRADRLPDEATWDGLSPAAPDLVAGILSINDEKAWYAERNDDLVAAYLEAGVRLAWVVDSGRRACQVRRPNETTANLVAENWLDGEDVLPGVRLPVAALVRPAVADER